MTAASTHNRSEQPTSRRRTKASLRGAIAAVGAVALWVIFGLSYWANIASLRDAACEVYCGPFDALTATLLLIVMPVMTALVGVAAVVALWGNRVDSIVAVSSLVLAVVPVFALAQVTHTFGLLSAG